MKSRSRSRSFCDSTLKAAAATKFVSWKSTSSCSTSSKLEAPSRSSTAAAALAAASSSRSSVSAPNSSPRPLLLLGWSLGHWFVAPRWGLLRNRQKVVFQGKNTRVIKPILMLSVARRTSELRTTRGRRWRTWTSCESARTTSTAPK